MKNTLYITGLMLSLTTLFTSCDKEFDTPPTKSIAVGNTITIAQARALYVPGVTTRITDDLSVYGVVTADETTGNLYKESYIQDETGALYLRFNSASGLYIGDSVRVNLNGAIVLKYNQMLQFDSLDADNNVIKIATQQYRTPELVSFADLLNDIDGYQGKLIQIDNVSFVERGLGLSFADGTNQVDESRFLEDFVSLDQLEVRTSGYCNFADDTLPDGNGSFIGICGQYNADIQLLIRNPQELTLTGPIPEIITKNFDDGNVSSGGWTIQEPIPATTTSLTWTTSTLGGASSPYGMMKNWSGTANEPVESWLISPSLDFSASTAPVFDFKNAYSYTGAPLEVLISTNYDGISTPSSAVWTSLSVALSSGSFGWVNASDNGPIDLTPYLVNNVYIAFKYTGGATSGSTWEIDDIKITK